MDIGGLFSLLALCHFKADLLAFFERLETAHVDCGKMCEQILAAIVGGNKSKTLCVVEPFNSTDCHETFSLLIKQGHPLRVIYDTETSMDLFFAFADLGSETLIMPSLNSAFTPDSSTSSGMRKLRTKLP